MSKYRGNVNQTLHYIKFALLNFQVSPDYRIELKQREETMAFIDFPKVFPVYRRRCHKQQGISMMKGIIGGNEHIAVNDHFL